MAINRADCLVIDFKDSTFRAPGKIGLWSKADAVTSFDSLSASAGK